MYDIHNNNSYVMLINKYVCMWLRNTKDAVVWCEGTSLSGFIIIIKFKWITLHCTTTIYIPPSRFPSAGETIAATAPLAQRGR